MNRCSIGRSCSVGCLACDPAIGKKRCKTKCISYVFIGIDTDLEAFNALLTSRLIPPGDVASPKWHTRCLSSGKPAFMSFEENQFSWTIVELVPASADMALPRGLRADARLYHFHLATGDYPGHRLFRDLEKSERLDTWEKHKWLCSILKTARSIWSSQEAHHYRHPCTPVDLDRQCKPCFRPNLFQSNCEYRLASVNSIFDLHPRYWR